MGAVQTDNRPEGFDRSDLIFVLAMAALLIFVLITSKLQTMETDFTFRDEGTIIVLVPHSDAARTWCDVNLPPDDHNGADTHLIEHRYFRDILNGILQEPLTIKKQ